MGVVSSFTSPYGLLHLLYDVYRSGHKNNSILFRIYALLVPDHQTDPDRGIRPRVVEYTDRARDIAQDLAYKQALAAEKLRRTEASTRPVLDQRTKEAVAFEGRMAGSGTHLNQQLAEDDWHHDNRETFNRDKERASFVETTGDRHSSGRLYVDEELIQPQQAAELYHQDRGLNDQDVRGRDQDVIMRYQDSRADYRDSRADYQDARTNDRDSRLDYQETRADYRGGVIPYQDQGLGHQDTEQQVTSSHTVRRSVRTSRVVQQSTTTRRVTGQQHLETQYTDQEGIMATGSIRADGGRYETWDPSRDYDPGGVLLESRIGEGQSARMVTTEHATWTQNRELRQPDDYSEV